jgi:hypothetical protein
VPTPRRPRADVSNTQTKTAAGFDFQRAVKEAATDPFPINVDVDTQILITAPSTDQIFEMAEAERRGDPREILSALCGDMAEQVLKLFGPADPKVTRSLMEAMQKHFGLDV